MSTDTKCGETSENENIPKPRDIDEIVTGSGGLRCTQHGFDFQIQLLMLFILRSMNENYFTFRIGSEVDAAEKFDDIVFQYKRNETDKWHSRLVNVRHSESEHIKYINIKDLLTIRHGSYGNFSLLKYFKSFLKIKERSQPKASNLIFADGEIVDLIICTTIDLDEKIKDCFDKIDLDHDQHLKLNNNLQKEYQNAAKYSLKMNSSNNLLSKLKSEFQSNIEKFEDDDFTEFLQKIKLIVGYPMRRQSVSDLINSELKTKLKIQEVSAAKLYFEMEIHDWMIKRIGTFLNSEEVNNIFEEIRKNIVENQN